MGKLKNKQIADQEAMYSAVEKTVDAVRDVANKYPLELAIPAICMVLCEAVAADYESNRINPAVTYEMMVGMLKDTALDLTGKSMEESLVNLNTQHSLTLH